MNRERVANGRRVVTRRNDENAMPARQAGRAAAKAAVTHAAVKPGFEAPGKVGAKRERNVLGAVTNVRDESVADARKPAKVGRETRQPLGRSNSLQQQQPQQVQQPQRAIAPVPQRGRTTVPVTVAPIAEPMEEDEVVTRRPAAEIELEGMMADGAMYESDLEDYDDDDWLRLSAENEYDCQLELQAIQKAFQDEIDMYDTTMVAEYADDIFEYMGELEVATMPNPRYMDFQTEIEWTMRTTLIDWLLQVHLRYHMLPETLWIAVNLVDRFLSVRVVSLNKLQLVGVTAMFIAAKYEEILAPSVDEFVYMTEKGYTKDEILKGERIILQTLDFNVSSYCSPYSWVRRISKADDYDLQTRTLSKFLMEVTLLDHRFLRCKPSMIAAIGMYLSRAMLGGDWNEAFVFYSGYTERQLVAGATILCERLVEQGFDKVYVYKKYSSKKFLRASSFACGWAISKADDFFRSLNYC